MKFIKKKTFYGFPVYEWNLPAGWSCPFARDCKIMVGRENGKMNIMGEKFRCYAAMSERFPAVREMRWKNYEEVIDLLKEDKVLEIPKGATHIRIHGSGDFFSQKYFDMWLEVCRRNPDVKFWAFTKSVEFWVNRLGEIPENLTLQASKGGYLDKLIDKYNLKYAEVFTDIGEALKSGLPIDTDDTYAMDGDESFALLDNNKYSKKLSVEELIDKYKRGEIK